MFEAEITCSSLNGAPRCINASSASRSPEFDSEIPNSPNGGGEHSLTLLLPSLPVEARETAGVSLTRLIEHPFNRRQQVIKALRTNVFGIALEFSVCILIPFCASVWMTGSWNINDLSVTLNLYLLVKKRLRFDQRCQIGFAKSRCLPLWRGPGTVAGQDVSGVDLA
jgi:hypothetical protein